MKFRLNSLVAVTLLALAACAPSSESPLGVSQILLGSGVNSRDEIEQPRTEFVPNQAMIYAHAFVTGLQDSTLVRGEWWFDSDDEPKKIYETNITVTSDRPVAKFAIQSTREWPVGDYRFLVFHETEQIGETTFEVKDE